MKCKLPQNELLKALRACEKSLLVRANLPILSNILINVSKNKLEVISTNLESATRVIVPCQGQIEGKTTLPGRILLEFVSQLPEGEAVLEKLGEEVLISMKSYQARLATITPEEFPAIPKIENGQEIKISASEFLGCSARTVFCASQDEGRPTLSGVLCEISKGKLTMVATDGYRLGYTQTSVQSAGNNIKIVIPAKAVGEAAKIISENAANGEKDVITLVIADSLNQLNFKINDIEYTSRLIEGEFPAWQKIIPSTFATKAKIDKEELIKKVRIASIFARDGGSIVRLKLENKTLTLMANSSQVGSNETQTPAQINGKGGEIAFNFRYLLEALAVIEGEEVIFEMSESLNPGRLTSTNTKDPFFHIIMPVRLQE